MEANNKATNVDHRNVSEAKSELENLGSNLQGQTALEDHRKAVLLQHMKDLKQNNQSWVSRLLLPGEDKRMLKVYGEKQIEAAELVLANQNEALKAICAGQVSFIKEVVNTLLKTGRSGLQGAAAVIYRENALAMHANMTRISSEFYTLVENKYKDGQGRLPFVQKQIMAEIELMMNNWNKETVRIQDDFGSILQEKV